MTPARDAAGLLLSAEASEQFSTDFPDAAVRDGVELFRAVRFLAQRMNEATAAWLSDRGMSATKFNYLAVLYARRSRGLTAGQLGAAVRTSSGSVTTMIDALERERLVVRQPHPSDGRSVVIKLTAKGERLFRGCAQLQHERVVEVLEQLGSQRGRDLLHLLVEAGNALHDVAARAVDERASA